MANFVKIERNGKRYAYLLVVASRTLRTGTTKLESKDSANLLFSVKDAPEHSACYRELSFAPLQRHLSAFHAMIDTFDADRTILSDPL